MTYLFIAIAYAAGILAGWFVTHLTHHWGVYGVIRKTASTAARLLSVTYYYDPEFFELARETFQERQERG